MQKSSLPPSPTPLPSALSTLTVILFIDRPHQFRLLLFWFIEYMAREREILSRFIGQSVSSHPLCSTEVNKISLSDPYIWCYTLLNFSDSTFSFNNRYVYTCVGFYHNNKCDETHILELKFIVFSSEWLFIHSPLLITLKAFYFLFLWCVTS